MSIKITTRDKFIVVLALLIVVLVVLISGCEENDALNIRTLLHVDYRTTDGGLLLVGQDPNTGNASFQLIDWGKDAEEVTAIPDEGYYFVEWSDGLKEAKRLDKNITSNVNFTAVFAPITDPVTVSYQQAGNGFVSGKCTQTVQRGTPARSVEAKLLSDRHGEIFLGWSDGLTNPVRQDVITDDIELIAKFGFYLNYKVQGNGSIVGEDCQAIVSGKSGESVTALPEKGYRFVEWSDGVKKATRQDMYVTKALEVCAIFEWRDTDTFKYNYNYATGNYYENGFTVTRGEAEGTSTVVPIREYFDFEGWYLDKKFTTQATDAEGNNILGEEIFNSPSRDLYAKWKVKENYVANYKILMVYVTAIDGTFVGRDGNKVEVHYRMDDEFKKQCLEITKRFKEKLDESLDGLVNFDIQSYFTTQSIDGTHFTSDVATKAYIYADAIPELLNSGMLDDYRSVFTLFSFGGVANLRFLGAVGLGTRKFASIPIDSNVAPWESLENLFDDPNGIIGTCVHEFIHTVECGIPCYDYHYAINYNVPYDVTDKLFLLNQFPIGLSETNHNNLSESFIEEAWRNSDKVGIPYNYWTNEIFDVVIEFKCINPRPDGYGGVGTVDYGGYVYWWAADGITEIDHWRLLAPDLWRVQRVPKGSRTTWLTAKADVGYKFIGWSDGCMDEARLISDVQENLTLIAYFERLSYSIEYNATAGGRIEGLSFQTALKGDAYNEVKAVADEGYKFIGWSDGRDCAERRDRAGGNSYYDSESGKIVLQGNLSVTAIFEAIE